MERRNWLDLLAGAVSQAHSPSRIYDCVVGLRAVTSTDGMTADFYPFDMKFLGQTATRIINDDRVGVG